MQFLVTIEQVPGYDGAPESAADLEKMLAEHYRGCSVQVTQQPASAPVFLVNERNELTHNGKYLGEWDDESFVPSRELLEMDNEFHAKVAAFVRAREGRTADQPKE